MTGWCCELVHYRDGPRHLEVSSYAYCRRDSFQCQAEQMHKNLCISAGKTRRLWMPDVDQRTETRHFIWFEFSVLFESEEWPSMEPKPNHRGTRNGTMIHRQLINVRNLSLWHDARPEEVPWTIPPAVGLILPHQICNPPQKTFLNPRSSCKTRRQVVFGIRDF
jgi:hypothetical protein